MSDTSFPCYACDATVVPGQRRCEACGRLQNKQAYDDYMDLRSAEAAVSNWKNLALFFAMFSLVLGAMFGYWLRAPQASTPQPRSAAEVALSLEQSRDVFLRSIQRAVNLGFVSWVPGPNNELVLELQPPTEEQPAVWQHLDAQEREQMMGLIAVAYTRSLLASGHQVDFEGDGHPVVILQYRGMDAPLAARGPEGQIRVYRSPYDQAVR